MGYSKSVTSSSDLEASVPCPRAFEITLLQLTQKDSNPSVGKILVGFINTKDNSKVLDERRNVFLTGTEVLNCFPTLGVIRNAKN